MAAPMKRIAYTAEFKLKAIIFAEEHGNRATERQFGVSEKSVRDWRNKKDSIMLMKRSKKANRGRNAKWPELEKCLLDFVILRRREGRGLSTVQIRLKAVEIAGDMNIEGFKGGHSWCYRFMLRNRLSIRQRTTMCQQLPPDFMEKIETFRGYVNAKIDLHSVTPDFIINMDEVPLTFDIPLGRTVNQKGERTINIKTTGHEKSHFTVVLACCASGKKLTPMVIFKRKTLPRETFPPNVVIDVNVKGWMNEAMMEKWLERCFVKRPDGFFKIHKALLVMDSMRAHITERIKNKLKFINTVPIVIPGGLTKMLQPLDISVNKSFKDNLRRLWENWMSHGEHSFTKTGRMRHATFSEVAQWVKTAWDTVSERTIISGFLKAEILKNLDGDDDDENGDADADDCEEDNEENELPNEICQLFHSDTEDEDFDGFPDSGC